MSTVFSTHLPVHNSVGAEGNILLMKQELCIFFVYVSLRQCEHKKISNLFIYFKKKSQLQVQGCKLVISEQEKVTNWRQNLHLPIKIFSTAWHDSIVSSKRWGPLLGLCCPQCV